MRVLKRFTSADLVATADVKRSNLEKLIRGLLAVGYLRLAGKTPGQSGFNIYSLVRNTGPLPPRIRADGSIFDPNTGSTADPGTYRQGQFVRRLMDIPTDAPLPAAGEVDAKRRVRGQS